MANQNHQINGDNGITSLPGFHFNPDDETLIDYYLRKKVSQQPLLPNWPIREMQIYGKEAQEPYNIAKSMGFSDQKSLHAEMYFYTIAKKNQGRVVGEGTWKIDRTHVKSLNGQVIGYMTVFKFVVKGKKFEPSWIMREYRLNRYVDHDQWVICKITRAEKNAKRSLTVDDNGSNKRRKVMADAASIDYADGPGDDNDLCCVDPPQPQSSHHCTLEHVDHSVVVDTLPTDSEMFIYADFFGDCDLDTLEVFGNDGTNGVSDDRLDEDLLVVVSPSSQSGHQIQSNDQPQTNHNDEIRSIPLSASSSLNQSSIDDGEFWWNNFLAELQEDDQYIKEPYNDVDTTWTSDYLLCC